ncbi:MAG: AMP-binding protein [Pseudomonadota bacterium]
MAALASEGSCDPRLHAAERPDAVAFTMSATGESVTFAVLEARANQGAQLLRQAGIGPGEHIAILMENRREFLEICFAADRAGIYYTTISTHLAAPEIAYILADCGARLLIVSERFSDQVAAIAGGLDGACALYALGGAIPGCLLWEEAVGRCPATPISDEAQGLDMLYSSGTTGRPKGVKWALTG